MSRVSSHSTSATYLHRRHETMARTPWTYVTKTPPAEMAVAVDQVKRAIRLSLDDCEHDDNLMLLIGAATEQVEADCAMAIVDQTFVYSRDEFNTSYRYFDLPIRPAHTIVGITYDDVEGNQATVDPNTYRLDQGRNQVVLMKDEAWPTDVQNELQVEFIAGHGETSEAAPKPLLQAIIMQVGKWFENPGMDMNETAVGEDKPYERIIRRYLRDSYP